MVILCLNSGSSSLKLALFDGAQALARGAVEGIGLEEGKLWMDPGPSAIGHFTRHEDAVRALFQAVETAKLPSPQAVGHRVVHGGPEHHLPQRVDRVLIDSLRHLTPFAPLHLPGAIAGMEAVSAKDPAIPQVACFDTAFHWGSPEVSRRFALPDAVHAEGVRRYGFHGLSYEFVVGAVELPRRAVVAHLGNGASMVALREGRAIDTTMGLTPAGGFMMGTRTGDLDPGVLLFLLRKGMSVDALESLINRESGLLGVSGKTFDMKELLAARARDSRAALAVEMFCYQCRKSVGALAAALGGLDALIFTGGIGERAAPVRAEICAGLEHLGIRLDSNRNDRGAPVISADGGKCIVRVVATDEDQMIARHTGALLGGA